MKRLLVAAALALAGCKPSPMSMSWQSRDYEPDRAADHTSVEPGEWEPEMGDDDRKLR
jgi:hypothetical protein